MAASVTAATLTTVSDKSVAANGPVAANGNAAASTKTAADTTAATRVAPRFVSVLAAVHPADTSPAGVAVKHTSAKGDDAKGSAHDHAKDDAEDPAALLALSGAVASTVAATAGKGKATAKAPAPSVSAAITTAASGSPTPAGPAPGGATPSPAGAATITQTGNDTTPPAAAVVANLVQQAAPSAGDAKAVRATTKTFPLTPSHSTADFLAARAAPKTAADDAANAAPATADGDTGKPTDALSATPTAMALPTQAITLAADPISQNTSGQALAATGADRQLDLAKGNAWLDGLARDIASTSDGSGTLRFQLSPQNLGNLHVEVTRGDAGATVRMTTVTTAAQAILTDAKPQLLAEAKAHGLHISEATVDLGSGQKQDQTGNGSGSSTLAQQTAGGQSHRQSQSQSQPQSEPDFYHSARKVEPAPSESADDSPRDDAGYA